MTLKKYLRKYWEDCKEGFDYLNWNKILTGTLISAFLTVGGCLGIKTLIDNPGKQNRNYLEEKVEEEKDLFEGDFFIILPKKEDKNIHKLQKKAEKINYKNGAKDFPKEELQIIYKTAKRIGVNPAFLMAIRRAENGKIWHFGVMPENEGYREDKGIIENGKFRYYRSRFEKQCNWAALSIKKNSERYFKSDKKYDFIRFMQKEYCPIGVKNDPRGLNKYWEGNVRKYFSRYSN